MSSLNLRSTCAAHSPGPATSSLLGEAQVAGRARENARSALGCSVKIITAGVPLTLEELGLEGICSFLGVPEMEGGWNSPG